MAVVVVVDDEPLQRDILKTILDAEGYETHIAASGPEALGILKKFHPDAMLIDLKMSPMDGIELLDAVPKEPFEPSMIIMTAHGTIASAVEAVKKGAFDYLTKPLEKETLLLTLGRALERASLLKENLMLKRELYEQFGMAGIEGVVGKSAKMRDVMEVIRKVSSSSVTVLISGESGTGKELVARAIHFGGQKRAKPFTALNCAAIPENLFESELFGYEPGAFTGASSRKEGLFEMSNGGTLFLDEIGDMPPSIQPKLLRVIEDKEIRRVGGKGTVKVDVRIIAASNKDLEKEIAKGAFREDLYYRLRVVRIELPPLRDRREDMPELAEFFIKRYNREFGKRIGGIEPQALKTLMAYGWPGNIRQLESVIERAVLMKDSGTIGPADVSGEVAEIKLAGAAAFDIPEGGLDLEGLERELIQRAIQKSGGVASKAAKLLGMSYKAFLYRWEKIKDAGDPR